MSATTNKHLLGLLKSAVATANNYYVVAGGFEAWPNENNPPLPSYSSAEVAQTFRNMLLAKKVGGGDVSFLIRRISWASGTIYDEYSPDNDDDSDFYVINSLNSVYKCIHNGDGVASTIEPVSLSNDIIETSDGYRWKYMYTPTSTELSKFASVDFIPVSANNAVVAAAIPGTIDEIFINEGGGNFVHTEGKIKQIVNSTTLRLDAGASISTDVYKNSALYITSGTGAGTLRGITASIANSSGVYVNLDAAANVAVNSDYIISPKVTLVGDGYGATAYSTVSANGTITDMTILTPGTNYTYATPVISTANNYGSNTSFTVIVSPKKGHGSDPVEELRSSKMSVYGVFGDDGLKFPDTNMTYRQLSLVYNPTTTSNTGTAFYGAYFNSNVAFTVGETVSVVGSNTNVSGIVVTSNTTFTLLRYASGNFQDDQVITGKTSGKVGQIQNVHNADTVRNSGDLLYYFNVSPINRVDNKSEKIRFIINLKEIV